MLMIDTSHMLAYNPPPSADVLDWRRPTPSLLLRSSAVSWWFEITTSSPGFRAIERPRTFMITSPGPLQAATRKPQRSTDTDTSAPLAAQTSASPNADPNRMVVLRSGLRNISPETTVITACDSLRRTAACEGQQLAALSES